MQVAVAQAYALVNGGTSVQHITQVLQLFPGGRVDGCHIAFGNIAQLSSVGEVVPYEFSLLYFSIFPQPANLGKFVQLGFIVVDYPLNAGVAGLNIRNHLGRAVELVHVVDDLSCADVRSARQGLLNAPHAQETPLT